MHPRMDTAFEIWGRFSEKSDASQTSPGRLRFDPGSGIELELVDYPSGPTWFAQGPAPPPATLFGQLVDGTLVTLVDCFVTKTSLGAGSGTGLPTNLFVNRALFRRHVDDLEQLQVKKYSVEFSSLGNWMSTLPLKQEMTTTDGKLTGLDASFRFPDPLVIDLPEREFDLKIKHTMNSRSTTHSFEVGWRTVLTITARDSMALEDAMEVAGNCQNLMSLLVGYQLSVESTAIETCDAAAENGTTQALEFLYCQRGEHEHREVHAQQMPLPYSMIKDEFPEIVKKWFERSEQAVLATNVFFGSQQSKSQFVNVKFLAILQAAESYHRSLGTGVYMEPEDYWTAISEVCSHLPAIISGDHRDSLKNRLRYGNEYSLRKRLAELLNRLPEDVQLRVAGNSKKWISRVVDTRNYYTHYDQASQKNALEGKDALIAAERVRILIVASLLHDLGVKDENLLGVLERSQELQYWLSQDLSI